MPISSSSRMRAAVITRPGGPEVLQVRDVERPVPGTGEVLVRVHATALNRADLLQRQGHYPAPPGWPADIPGMEVAGEVAARGPGASLWKEGDRVFGIVGGGGYAEYVATHERTLAAVPSRLTWTDAGAVPEAFITAHDALVSQAGLRPAERVLIHAVGSGVGLAALQIVRAAGGFAYGDARSPEKIERARSLGLSDGLVVTGDLTEIPRWVGQCTRDAGVEIVIDLVGGPYFIASIGAAAPRARIVLVGTMGGREASIPLGVVLGKRLTIIGTVLRARPLEEKILATRAFAAQVVPLLDRGAVRPVVDRVFPLERVADAHRYLESNATFGKVVIDVLA
jgi:NADPH:quinone reductase